jgi:hypothetical protein
MGDPHEVVGRHGGIENLEGSGVGALVLLFLSTDSVSPKGTGHDDGREGSKQDKRRSETART